MQTTTAAKTIDCLEEVFARQGLCDILSSDNGPQLISAEFEKFCEQKGIEHVRTAPYHPQSNGQVKRFVALLKTGLKKLEGEGGIDRILRKFLFCYRYTPSAALEGKSPFQVMTGRIMKTKLDLLKPDDKQRGERNNKMEQQFDKHHGAVWKEFDSGENVFVKVHNSNGWKWMPATIIKRTGAVDYTVSINES